MHRFFQESVKAVRELGVRAMLVTNFPEQVPTDLPSGVKTFGYLPFSDVLPHAAMLVYHGGIGTLAQTIKAGIPHLVVPSGHDQFDNGWRIEQLGLGRSIPQTRYRADRVVRADPRDARRPRISARAAATTRRASIRTPPSRARVNCSKGCCRSSARPIRGDRGRGERPNKGAQLGRCLR